MTQTVSQPSDNKVENGDVTRGFGSSDGGDFTLRSQDGVDFRIHSLILRCASPVFESLLSLGTGEPLVTLTEEAKIVRLMLVYVYFAEEQPFIEDYIVLEKVFDVARKYEIVAMTASLRTLFLLENSRLCARNNPIAAYEIACMFDLKDVQKAAYQHCIPLVDLSDVRTVTEIIPSCRHPRFVLPLIAKLARRRAIITEVLHAIHQFPLNLAAGQWDATHVIRDTLASRLICEKCIVAYNETSFGAVSWQMYWANRAHGTLLKRSMRDCAQVFEVGFLCKPYDEDEDLNVFCEDCFTRIHLKNHKTWEIWAQVVHDFLVDSLGDCL